MKYILDSRIKLKCVIMLQDFSHALLKRKCLACGGLIYIYGDMVEASIKNAIHKKLPKM
jgi:hypothetical protein